MIVPTDPNPFAPSSTAERVATATQMREVARRRWQAQKEHEEQQRRRQRQQVVDRVKHVRQLRPGRAVVNSLSPVYNMFNEAVLRGR